MIDIHRHLNALTQAEPPDEPEADAPGEPPWQADILAKLMRMERAAYDAFNACCEWEDAMSPFASVHCEVHRVKAAAFREARVELSAMWEKDAKQDVPAKHEDAFWEAAEEVVSDRVEADFQRDLSEAGNPKSQTDTSQPAPPVPSQPQASQPATNPGEGKP